MLNVKKLVAAALIVAIGTWALSLSWVFSAMAASSAAIDKADADKGIITVSFAGDMKTEQAVVVIQYTNGDKWQYTMQYAEQRFPLQDGSGDYQVMVGVVQTDGKTAKVVLKETVTAKIAEKDANEMYLLETIHDTVWDDDMKAIKGFDELIKKAGAKTDKEILDVVYNEVAKNYKYNDARAKDIADGKIAKYAPDIDEMYTSKAGICQDYACIVAAVLRHNGIPAKYMGGFSPDVKELHAWNEVFVDGKWITIDLTVDSEIVRGGGKVVREKDAAKYVVKSVF